jgi:hypothetical protein
VHYPYLCLKWYVWKCVRNYLPKKKKKKIEMCKELNLCNMWMSVDFSCGQSIGKET